MGLLLEMMSFLGEEIDVVAVAVHAYAVDLLRLTPPTRISGAALDDVIMSSRRGQ